MKHDQRDVCLSWIEDLRENVKDSRSPLSLWAVVGTYIKMGCLAAQTLANHYEKSMSPTQPTNRQRTWNMGEI